VDRRANVYALGALLVFLLTGTEPSAAAPAAPLLAPHRDVPAPLRAIADSFADYARVTFVSSPGGGVAAIQWGPGTWGAGKPGPRFERLRSP